VSNCFITEHDTFTIDAWACYINSRAMVQQILQMQPKLKLAHLMRTKIDVARMQNDVIISISDALSKQP